MEVILLNYLRKHAVVKKKKYKGETDGKKLAIHT